MTYDSFNTSSSANIPIADPAHTPSRRHVLLGLSALSGVSALALSGCGGSAAAETSSQSIIIDSNIPPITPQPTGSGVQPIFGANKVTRQANVLNAREAAALYQSGVNNGTQTNNGDEGLFADYRASFSKALPHNELGEVDVAAYDALLNALETTEHSDFEAIPLGGTRKLANPQAAYRLEMVGLDSHSTFMRPAPIFAGLETAAEMGELYWKSLCRDVPFIDYNSNSLIQSAVTDLNAFSETVGATSSGSLSRATIFRGETSGDPEGPYLSQFLLKDVPFGNHTIIQKYATPAPGDDFMTDTASWLSVQRGQSPAPLQKGTPRYISDARALGEYVHQDFTYQAYMNAALIMLSFSNTFDFDNIYNTSATQGGFATLGGPDVLDLVAKAGNLALSGAWYQKWLVHRRARPEVYAGRLHHQITGAKDYGLSDEIIDSEGLARVFSNTGTYLLPMAFPEGSPTHPSYPAGHATISGACATVLKAYFEETLHVPNPVIPNADGQSLTPYFDSSLTLGGEINKLANNIALGRDWAGVHYRSDGVDGLLVGEQQAIGLLLDYSRTYKERFGGFTFTKFDGQQITIKEGEII